MLSFESAADYSDFKKLSSFSKVIKFFNNQKQLQLFSLNFTYTTLIQLITINKLGLYHPLVPGT